MKIKNILSMFLLSTLLGAVIGGVLWVFLRVMSFGIELIWTKIPGLLPEIPGAGLYPLVICIFGGLCIGILQKKWGPCPKTLMEVITVVKKENYYDYHGLHRMLMAAILPLLFGGAIGPEAGLTGVFVGLCYWAGDHLKFARKVLPEMAEVGISATLAVIFGSPFFGFFLPLEEDPYSDHEIKLPKGTKILASFCGIFGALLLVMTLNHFIGHGQGLPRFGSSEAELTDLPWMIPLVIVGIAFGWFFKLSGKCVERLVRPLSSKPILLAILGGVVLSIVQIFFPHAMFSGEVQMEVLITDYAIYTPWFLLAMAAVKMVMIHVCIDSGWRGGHFFPAIFAGVAAGYAMAAILPLDPVFSCAVVCAAVVTTILRKPFAAAMLLMLCFPANCLLFLIGAAFLATLVPNFGGKRHESA